MKIQKKNLAGQVVFEYDGNLLECRAESIVLEAIFGRDDVPVVDAVLRRGDRFVETFYFDRWYNTFEIYDRDDGALKGWYCNVGRPATLEGAELSYVDLALDLWVAADGKQTVLDEDEFEALGLPAEVHEHACAALRELQALFNSKKPPQ